jgi:hypothetical protein|uniref:Uncharacterized protein n=1 Tax=viral metagenome TaxID=1070528 RepID=A0A6C0IWB8_9ZZZZ
MWEEISKYIKADWTRSISLVVNIILIIVLIVDANWGEGFLYLYAHKNNHVAIDGVVQGAYDDETQPFTADVGADVSGGEEVITDAVLQRQLIRPPVE